MKRIVFFSIFISFCASLMAQTSGATPKRTPEEVALKQTEMLVRELGITDSLQRDSVYRIHLRYTRMRFISNTRAQELDRMQSLYAELRGILTPKQYHQFMNMPRSEGPRRPESMPRCERVSDTSSSPSSPQR